MKINNPRIQAEINLLTMLSSLDFDNSMAEYTGDFLPGDAKKWLPKFHYYQGVEHFRREIISLLSDKQQEMEDWKADV